MFNAGAKKLQRGLFAESPRRTEVSHADRRLKRQAGGHDFPPDRSDMFVLERAFVSLLNLLDHLRDPVRSEKWRTVASLDLPDLLGDVRPLVE